MQSRKLTFGIVAAAIAATALVPAGAQAASQTVLGTTSAASVAIGAPADATFASTLGTSGTVDTAGGTVAVTAIGPWFMRVSGSDAGKLKRTTTTGLCAGSTDVLNNALGAFPTAALTGTNFTAASTTTTPLGVTGSAQLIANGTGSNTVTLVYRYSPDPTDQLTAACPYAMTSTVAIAAV